MELKFVNTCQACPEQYDIFDVEDDNKQVGYLRLRWGCVSVRVPDSSGKEVYSSLTIGEGTFNDASEREFHLTKAAEAIEHYLYSDNDFEAPGDFIISV